MLTNFYQIIIFYTKEEVHSMLVIAATIQLNSKHKIINTFFTSILQNIGLYFIAFKHAFLFALNTVRINCILNFPSPFYEAAYFCFIAFE